MATVFHVRPQRVRVCRAHAFTDALGALRSALDLLEETCAEDPARCRLAAAMLHRLHHEVVRLNTHEDPGEELL